MTTSALDLFRIPLAGLQAIEASAGTGKTWTICGLYVRLILESGLSVREILVVTFTRAATGELKDRIRSRLIAVSRALEARARGAAVNYGEDVFVPALAAQMDGGELGIDCETALARIRSAIAEYDEAAVFTIHGFCQRALADAPFSAGLPFAFELRPDDAAAIERVAADFYRTHIVAGLDEPLLSLLADRLSPADLAGHLLRRLARPLSRMQFEAGNENPDALTRYAALFENARALWRTERDEIVAGVRHAQLRATSYTEASIRNSADAWDDLLSAPHAALFIAGEAYKHLTASHLERNCLRGAAPPRHEFHRLAQQLADLQAGTTAAVEQAQLRLLQQFLSEAPERVRELKHRRRVLAYDDILYKVYRALSEGGELAGALRRRFPAALIDEFQDTDPLQLDIFTRVYGSSDSPAFLVGDPKQSIYGFRDADLYAYLKMRRAVERTHELTENQRSTPELIAALNALYSRCDAPFLLREIEYRTVTAGQRAREPFCDCEPAALHVWLLPNAADGTLLGKSAATDAVVQATAAEVSRLLVRGRNGEARIGARGVAPGDIAVIVRDRFQGVAVKEALVALGIGAVLRTQDSVFNCDEAEEVQRLLAAIAQPGNLQRLKTALAGELMGLSANEIDALMSDESALADRGYEFARYAELLNRRGFAAMWRTLLAEYRVVARLLPRAGGERRVTNYLHIGELLHHASGETHGVEELRRWLAEARARELAPEEHQMRLESDQRLVQVMTIHVAKGLEFPVTFCPFLWARREANDAAAYATYHDEEGKAVECFGGDLGVASANSRREAMAEDLRLLYVALTRAIYRTYLVAGIYRYGKDGGAQARASSLNWLIGGQDKDPDRWLDGDTPSAQDILAAWTSLADVSPHIRVRELPGETGEYFGAEDVDTGGWQARVARRTLRESWTTSSFTSLNAEPGARAAMIEGGDADHDEHVVAVGESSTPAELHPLLKFPRGPLAGVLLHAAFEYADLAQPATWDEAIALAIRRHRIESDEPLAPMLKRALANVCATPLDGRDLRLSSIARSERLHELAFTFTARSADLAALSAAFAEAGLPVAAMSERIDGFVRGAIDCIVRHRGRFHLLDWKSNDLGDRRDDYTPRRLAQAMAAEGYHLQYALYALALHRYLARRVPGYDYERDFGEVFYVFARGCRPDWLSENGAPYGVFRTRLPAALIARLDRLFGGAYAHS